MNLHLKEGTQLLQMFLIITLKPNGTLRCKDILSLSVKHENTTIKHIHNVLL